MSYISFVVFFLFSDTMRDYAKFLRCGVTYDELMYLSFATYSVDNDRS